MNPENRTPVPGSPEQWLEHAGSNLRLARLASRDPAIRREHARFPARQAAEKSGETLPPGVTENELLAACVGPDLDNITATTVLSELRNTCLYLRYDGVRYCSKKDPNVTRLIEDAEQTIPREETQARGNDPVRAQIKEMLDERLAGHPTAIVWPAKSHNIPDEDPRFLVAYRPLEFAAESKAEQERRGKEYLAE